MNERAFNLFTALLALILIVLTSTLLSSMVQSESNTKTVISKLMSQTKLESMSRLIRADAFQTFKYIMTEQLEKWLSENRFTIGVDHRIWEDWNKVVEEFTNVYFKNEQAFAGFLGQQLPSQLIKYNDKYVAGYQVEVDFDREGFVEELQKVVVDSAEERDFFEIVDCDGTPQGCPNGSFYIKLEFSEMEQEAYEKMPLVTVKDLRSGSAEDEWSGKELKDPIIPRNDLKVFVPLRLFRALAITRGYMHSELSPAKINSGEDHGFYSPRVHNEIDSMALGFCDFGYCAPRTNPYFPPEKKYVNTQNCPGSIGTSSLNVTGEFRGESISYNAGNKQSMKNTMEELVEKRLCELSRELIEPYNDPEFEIKKTTVGGKDCYVSLEKFESDSTLSKKIEKKPITALDTTGTGPVYTIDDEPNHFGLPVPECPFRYSLAEQRRIGVYNYGGDLKIPGDYYGSDVCSGFGLSGIQVHCGMASPSSGNWSCCTEISALTLLFEFKENNPHYKVNKDRDVRYRIRVFNKNYTPFNPNYDFGALDLSCSLNPGSSSPTEKCNEKGWTCYVPAGGSEGCYPPKNI